MVYPKAALCWIIFTLEFTGIASQDGTKKEISVDDKNDQLTLKCPYKQCEWKHEGVSMDFTNCDLDLGSVWDDPRGTYSCKQRSEQPNDHGQVSAPELFIDVYVRKCQNCIELDAGTISGFLIADFIMIGLIAMAVYFVSGSETRRPGRASDKQNLIDRDQEYQELGLRRNEEYSQLAGRKRNAI